MTAKGHAHLLLGRLVQAERLEVLGGLHALVFEPRQEAPVQGRFNGGRRHAELCRLLHRPLACTFRDRKSVKDPATLIIINSLLTVMSMSA